MKKKVILILLKGRLPFGRVQSSGTLTLLRKNAVMRNKNKSGARGFKVVFSTTGFISEQSYEVYALFYDTTLG